MLLLSRKTLHCNRVHFIDISGERIWTEMKKILEGRFAAPILKVMLELNMGKYLGM